MSIEKVLTVVIVLVIATIIAVIAWAVDHDTAWKEKCEAAGGRNASSESRFLCLQKSAVIEIK